MKFLSLGINISTFILLMIGGTVNPSGSSLACPDWPTCFGSYFPEMTGGVFYEHSHRIVATLVGFLTLIFCGLTFLKKYPFKIKLLASIQLILVIIQGTLGGITVLYGLPAAISTLHLMISLIYFCFTIYLTFCLFEGKVFSLYWGDKSKVWFSLIATVLLYFQIVLGAVVRHQGAGRACGTDMLSCLGEFWPIWLVQQIHMLHRYSGYTIFILLILGWYRSFKEFSSFPLGIRLVFQSLPLLLVIQVILGILTVSSNIGLWITTFHMALACFILGMLWAGYLWQSSKRFVTN